MSEALLCILPPLKVEESASHQRDEGENGQSNQIPADGEAGGSAADKGRASDGAWPGFPPAPGPSGHGRSVSMRRAAPLDRGGRCVRLAAR